MTDQSEELLNNEASVDPAPSKSGINRKVVTHLYAVLRHDRFHSDSVSPEKRITVKEVHPTWEMAQAEVERLNALQAERGIDCHYWCQATR